MSILERFNLHLSLASPPSTDLPTEWPNLETFKNALVEVGKTTGLWEKTEWEAFSSSESEVYVRGVLDVDERLLFAYLEDEGRIVKLETLLHRALPSGVSALSFTSCMGSSCPCRSASMQKNSWLRLQSTIFVFSPRTTPRSCLCS